MKVDHQGYRRMKLCIEHYQVTVVGRFFNGLILGVVKTIGTWVVQGCVNRGSTSDCQLGLGTACIVEAVGYWGKGNDTLLTQFHVLTTIVFFETGGFFAVIGCAERVTTILRNNTRFRLTFSFAMVSGFFHIQEGFPRSEVSQFYAHFHLQFHFPLFRLQPRLRFGLKRSILMRSSLLALEVAVDFLDAPEAIPLIGLAEPCMSVQCWGYVAKFWSYSAFFTSRSTCLVSASNFTSW